MALNFVWDVTLGNVVTIVGGILVSAMIFQRMSDKVDSNSKDTEKIGHQLEEVVKLALPISVNQHERRLTTLEVTLGAMQTALAAMQSDIAWIKQAIKDLKGTDT